MNTPLGVPSIFHAKMYPPVTGRIKRKNQGWLEEGQQETFADKQWASFPFPTFKVCLIFLGILSWGREEVSSYRAWVPLDFSLKNLTFRVNRSAKLFRVERPRMTRRNRLNGQKFTRRTFNESAQGLASQTTPGSYSRPNHNFLLCEQRRLRCFTMGSSRTFARTNSHEWNGKKS